MSNKRLIDGDKLLEWLEEEIKDFPEEKDKDVRYALKLVKKRINSGRFDSNQGEAARLREALERIEFDSQKAQFISLYGANNFKEYIREIAREALSGEKRCPICRLTLQTDNTCGGCGFGLKEEDPL